MKKFIVLVSAALSLTFAFSAFAKDKKPADKKSSDSYEVPWGMAGCGVWNKLFPDKSQGPQIGQYVLDMFTLRGFQTSMITSGTSNCVAEGGKSARMDEQSTFVSVNMTDLQKEAAQGKGQHLDTLAEIFGCSDKEAFAHMSQNRYEAIFSNENPSNVVESYKSEIKSAKASCERAG